MGRENITGKSKTGLVSKAAKLVPALRERGALTDELRQLPPETLADLNELNVLGTVVPERLGGFGFDPEEAFKISVEIARGDGSAGWLSSHMALHNFFIGYFPQSVQDEVWGGPTVPFVGNGFTTHRTSCERVPGGYRVSGRWDFGSGIMHAGWYIATAIADDGPRNFVVPAGQWEVVDTWDTVGLRGTGSHDVVLKDVFVPETHSLNLQDMLAGSTPGAALQESPMYKIPAVLFGPAAATCTILGLAYAAVELFDERCRSTAGGSSGILGSSRPDMALRTAMASAQVDACSALFWPDLEEMKEYAARDIPIPDQDRIRYRRNHAYVASKAAQAVAHLYEAAGATALGNSNALNRVFRDATAASHHYHLSRDTIYLAYGRYSFGLDPEYPWW